MAGSVQLAAGLNASDQETGVAFNKSDQTAESTWSMPRKRRGNNYINSFMSCAERHWAGWGLMESLS